MGRDDVDYKQLLISEREIRIRTEAELKRSERRVAELEAKVTSAMKASRILKDNSVLTPSGGRSKEFRAYDFDGDGIWHIDVKNRVVSFSPGFTRKFGIETEDITGVLQTLRNIAVDGTQSALVSMLDAREHAEDQIQSTCKLRTVEGEARWVLEKAQIVERDELGEPKLIFGETIDITYQKEIEEQFKVVARRFAGLLDNLQMGVLVEDESRKIALVNPNFCELFKLDDAPEDLLGLDCGQTAEIFAAFFDNSEGFISRIEHLLQHRERALNEEIQMRDGRWIERDYIPILIDDEYRGNLWKYRDITERKMQETRLRIREEKYRSIIENMNLGILEVDSQERIQYANQSFCRMSEYALDELVGRNASELFVIEEHKDRVTEKTSLRSQGISDAYELRIRNRNGEEKWWLISGAPRYNDDGQLAGSIGIHLDITEQKLLQQELIAAKERADQSVEARDSFIANISHEIRTPMNAIIGLGALLAKTSLNGEQNRYLQHINNSARNLLVILNDVLDYSKLEAGKLSIEKIGFSLREAIERATHTLGFKAEEKGLALFFNYDPRISEVLMGDPSRLNQIMMNLLGNAIKFTEEGSITVQCSMLRNEIDQQLIRISVSDTGIGMDEAYLQRIFEKFTQEDERISKVYGGTGLGMTITLELVKLMKGHLHIQSKKGSGTQVTIECVFEKGQAIQEKTSAPTAWKPNAFKGLHVLLVEDNPTNRIVATSMMEPHGIRVAEAENGYEALEYLNHHQPDVVLMDVQMPGIDGLETTQLIRQKFGNRVPILALTANVLLPMQVRCRESGMNDFLAKPYEEEDLMQKIAQLTGCVPHNEIAPSIAPPSESVVLPLEPVHAPLYNLAKLEKLSRGDADFLQRMLSIFMAEVPKTVDKLRDALAQNDLAQVKHWAHRLKPSINDMGISSLKELLQQTEDAALEGNAAIPARHVPVIYQTVQEVMEQLQRRSA